METQRQEIIGVRHTKVCTWVGCGVVLIHGVNWKVNKTSNSRNLLCHEHYKAQHRVWNATQRGKKNLPSAPRECKPLDPILEERRQRIAANAAFNNRYEQTPRQYVVDGCVYVITNPAFPGMVKIGWAADPDKRLGDYTMYAPTPYKLEDYSHAPSIAAEAAVHDYFSNCHVSGEWFRVSAGIAVTAVEIICREQSVSGRVA